MKAAKKAIVLNLPEPVLAALDELARREWITRSAAIRRAIIANLAQHGVCVCPVAA